jgi:autotransporter adhesin
LTNIAAGIEAADAVNLGQLNGAISTAQAYTDARLSAMSYDLANVRQDVKAIRRDAEGATASAMALAGIPQTFERGKGMVGLGVGTWQGESAIAVGLSKATDDGRFVLKAGASYNSRSQGGANAGVGWAF